MTGNTWKRNVGWALETRAVVAEPLAEKRQTSGVGPRDKLARGGIFQRQGCSEHTFRFLVTAYFSHWSTGELPEEQGSICRLNPVPQASICRPDHVPQAFSLQT